MLRGISVSSDTPAMSFSPYDFVIVRSTIGKNEIDSMYSAHTAQVISDKKLLGFYHTPDPLNNDAIEEAEFMLNTINSHLRNCIIVLDWVGTPDTAREEWALAFVQYLAIASPARPIIKLDTNEENFSAMDEVRDNGFGLWIKDLVGDDITGELEPNVKSWAIWALWENEVT